MSDAAGWLSWQLQGNAAPNGVEMRRAYNICHNCSQFHCCGSIEHCHQTQPQHQQQQEQHMPVPHCPRPAKCPRPSAAHDSSLVHQHPQSCQHTTPDTTSNQRTAADIAAPNSTSTAIQAAGAARSAAASPLSQTGSCGEQSTSDQRVEELQFILQRTARSESYSSHLAELTSPPQRSANPLSEDSAFSVDADADVCVDPANEDHPECSLEAFAPASSYDTNNSSNNNNCCCCCYCCCCSDYYHTGPTGNSLANDNKDALAHRLHSHLSICASTATQPQENVLSSSSPAAMCSSDDDKQDECTWHLQNYADGMQQPVMPSATSSGQHREFGNTTLHQLPGKRKHSRPS